MENNFFKVLCDKYRFMIYLKQLLVDADNDGRVCVHFDGWSDKYDYWTEFTHPDLMPCGFHEYFITTFGYFDYRGLKSFHAPKGTHNTQFLSIYIHMYSLGFVFVAKQTMAPDSRGRVI